VSELGDKIREKIKKVSKGEYDTWGIVAMVFDFITEAEEEVKPLESRVRELEAERDRLIENHTKAQHAILKLRARHAALVQEHQTYQTKQGSK
jgi:phage shock protein A